MILSRRHRTPLTPVNVETPRQVVTTSTDFEREVEANAEHGENFSSILGDMSQGADPDAESTHHTSTSSALSTQSVEGERLSRRKHKLPVVRSWRGSV